MAYVELDDSSDIYRAADSLRLLNNICCRDQKSRQQALDLVWRTVDGWIEGYGSPPRHSKGLINCRGCLSISIANPKETAAGILPDILRLSLDCPYEDVRDRCRSILTELESRGIIVPKPLTPHASDFIGIEPKTQLLMDVFLQNNRLEHVFQVMSLHPKYLECFLRSHQYLLREGGPLPNSLRHYIAVMAAASHKCSYLVNLHAVEFLTQGGDANWLNGLNCVPEKIQRLAELNRILAHRPWLITIQHIKKLVHSDEDRLHNWSVSELMHAVVLLAHFHSLASFVFGCGVVSEIDHPDGHSYSPSEQTERKPKQNSDDEQSSSTVQQVLDSHRLDSLVETMRQINDEADDDVSEDESYYIIASQNAELLEVTSSPAQKLSPVWGGSILRFVDDSAINYLDFERLGEKSTIPTFRNRDFSWEDHGFSLAERLYMDIGALLDDRFSIAQNLTYHTLGNKKDVDTRMFRRAVWNYIHSLFGIRHDDYNYSVVSQLLENNFMTYIKLVTCIPESVTNDHYQAFMKDLLPSEKVHLNIMLLEAKLQAELLYVFRAVSEYIDGRSSPVT